MPKARVRIDAVTELVAPTTAVLHLTDPAVGWRPVALGRADWFTLDEAREYAKEASAAAPAPQRFAIYDGGRFVESWQCGERIGAFTIVETIPAEQPAEPAAAA